MESQDELVLNEVHKDLISDYLRFARQQQHQRLRSIDYCFTHLLAFKIREDETYTGEEVNALLDDLHQICREDVISELIDATHTNALLLNQLLLQAQTWHLTLSANIADLENQEKITKMRELDEALSSDGSSGLKITVSKTKKFPPLEDMNDPSALKLEVIRLIAENDILKSKMENCSVQDNKEKQANDSAEESKRSEDLRLAQEEIDRLMIIVKEKSEQDTSYQKQVESVYEALEKMRVELKSTQRLAAEQTEKLRQDLESRENKLRQVQSSLLLAEKDLEKKFQATGAFITMKKIMHQKNDQIKTLREKLMRNGALEEEIGGEGHEDEN